MYNEIYLGVFKLYFLHVSFRFNLLLNSMFSNNNLLCINPDTTLSVFLSMYPSDTTRPQTLCSLHKKLIVSKCNNAKVRVQLIYILGFMLHINERSTGSRSTFEFPSRVNFSVPSLYCIAWTLGK